MKTTLFDFQETALAKLRDKLATARSPASVDNPQAISFSAPTGSGKTIIMTALFEDIFSGQPGFEPQPDAAILWISDMPELNEQTLRKIIHQSDRIRVGNLVTVDTWFDAERLPSGHIFFMNTQKLGSDKLLTRRGDGRQHTIWETLTNTARAASPDEPCRFYVVIDEAHRGMRQGGKAAEKAKTILQRFLLGSPDDGLCRMPLVIGMSATPRRFDALLSGTSHTVHKVHVPSDAVRESGLLKERILIHYPETANQAEMTLLSEAARRWQSVAERWKAYCKAEGDSDVSPILVIQVEDGSGKTLTKTDLAASLNTLEDAIGRQLKEGEVAHTFNDQNDLLVGNRRVRRIDASRIQEDKNIGVVLFKMSLSTGWDCPRAEVMMSFRRAQDHTYIAQLLGRMVRTPLARRIERDAALNDVHLFLPHYDQATVAAVIEDLKNAEDVPPAKVGIGRELVILHRREGMEDVFAAMAELITYRVNRVRRQSALRRLMGLGRGLTHDRIDEITLTDAKNKIVEWMAAEIQGLRDSDVLAERAKAYTGIDMKTIAVDRGTGVAEEQAPYIVEAAPIDIDRHFEQAGRLLGNGLHMDYWRSRSERDAGEVDAAEVKAAVVVLTKDSDAMARLERFAEEEFDALYAKHKRDIGRLREPRRQHYERLRLATADPRDVPWRLPETIDFRRDPKAPEYENHLYLDDDGRFRAELGNWEREVLAEELADTSVVGWLRNVDRKPWSLEIPYRDGGEVKPLFPDFVVARKDAKGFLFDILEPHDPALKDNAAKAVGLAEFAEKHGYLFQRIQLIRKVRGAGGGERYRRLDVGNAAVRREVLAVESNHQLDRIFENKARPREF
ncbi:MAG: DEAD/DEAH box helicase family protein [Gammaproteobacteria bacterium]|nr:DEAD/DEAH box helicase family protein [Gammaproteobacteria bacterium]NNJ83391.1 DEAD/DEAH box helicase family protein [Gammaproteobacteria bacterium]